MIPQLEELVHMDRPQREVTTSCRVGAPVPTEKTAVRPQVKKLVYVYLVRYAEEQQDLALLSISTFQRGLKVSGPSAPPWGGQSQWKEPARPRDGGQLRRDTRAGVGAQRLCVSSEEPAVVAASNRNPLSP